MPSVPAEAVCVPFLCPDGVCTRSHGRAAACAGVDLSGCHGIEPQRVPSVAAEAVCLSPDGILCR